MNRSLRIALISLAVIVAIVGLLAIGFVVGRSYSWANAFWPGGMMSGIEPGWPWVSEGPMSGFGGGRGYHGRGMMGWGARGMMGGYGYPAYGDIEPISLDAAQTAVEEFLAEWGDEDLILHEIMIFDNHAYAEVVEESTGIGAMELLVDPVTLSVYPEHGPNMMWNPKYGMMGAAGGYGHMGRMGFYGGAAPEDLSADMPVSEDEAAEIAQRYLDDALPGAQAGDHAEPFYGYYTLHILRDGEVEGMLSVNGYNGQVFLHTWHGEFIEMSEMSDSHED